VKLLVTDAVVANLGGERVDQLTVDGGAAKGVVVLAHGSGIAMDHEYMNNLSKLFNECGLKVVRFEFPFMAKRRSTGKKGFPDKMPVLLATYLAVIKEVLSLPENDSLPLYLAGKSLGGRVATLIAAYMHPTTSCSQLNSTFSELPITDKVTVNGVFVYGYPFHSIKKPAQLRIEHLLELATDVYIFQGSRDKLGTREEVLGYPLSQRVKIQWFEDADHDLKPRVKSGYTQKQYLKISAQTVAVALGGN